MDQFNIEIVADSISTISGDRITTFKLRYPRFIHSEMMTHRQFSRNASSSRAVPVKKSLGYILDNMAKPTHWGANRAGMTAPDEEHKHKRLGNALWHLAGYLIVGISWLMSKIGFHKQIANRISEPFSHITAVFTATDWDNFFELRCHESAQPEIRELACEMHHCYSNSMPNKLGENEWHLPFVNKSGDGYYSDSYSKISLIAAIKVSVSCCCQVSYRNQDSSLVKAFKIFSMLRPKGSPPHASPFEHQAKPMGQDEVNLRALLAEKFKEGVPNYVGIEKDAEQLMYSANFKGWRSYRRDSGM